VQEARFREKMARDGDAIKAEMRQTARTGSSCLSLCLSLSSLSLLDLRSATNRNILNRGFVSTALTLRWWWLIEMEREVHSQVMAQVTQVRTAAQRELSAVAERMKIEAVRVRIGVGVGVVLMGVGVVALAKEERARTRLADVEAEVRRSHDELLQQRMSCVFLLDEGGVESASLLCERRDKSGEN
jgi:hypothetical protein